MGRYNLLEEQWIPLMRNDGEVEKSSIIHLFQHASEYRGLAGDMATQNFSLLRLLLAIVLTVYSRVDAEGNPYPWLTLDGNEGDKLSITKPVTKHHAREYEKALKKTWLDIWDKHAFSGTVIQYLSAWKDYFFLYDDARPFFQIGKEDWMYFRNKDIYGKGAVDVQKGEKKLSLRKMNRLVSESNHKAAMFSPLIESEKDSMSDDAFARWLIMYQAYAGRMDKATFSQGTTSKGWLFEIGGIYLEGDSLFETLLLNSTLPFVSDSVQHPCWEIKTRDYVEERIDNRQIKDLAALYTNWSAAIYNENTKTEGELQNVWVVKFPKIDATNFFLEPMTVFEEKKPNCYTPRSLKMEEAMWRSFGMIAESISNKSIRTRKPEIIRFYDALPDRVHKRTIMLCAVGMHPKDETSAIPYDEISDVLYFNPILLLDTEDDGWTRHIKDAVEDTKQAVEKYYERFLYHVSLHRNLQNSKKKNKKEQKTFTSKGVAALYEVIDQPFRIWLSNIVPEESKEDQIHQWKKILRKLVLESANRLMARATTHDFALIAKEDAKGNLGKPFNIVTAYNWLKRDLSKI